MTTPLPTMMTVIEIAAPGGPEVLRPAQRPMPLPGTDEVLIEIAAAGINRPDVMQRLGKYPPPPGASDIPGLEVAGRIVATGPGVPEGLIGQEVCALLAGGGYASHCLAPAPLALPIPRGLSLIEAAALPETVFTVWTNLVERGGLRHGESVLIHGGTSGIGTIAIQLGRALGGRIFATAGSAEKCRACEDLGAERGIDYKNENFVQIVTDATGGRGVDLILDIVGGDYTQRNLQSLAIDGRLVNIAVQRGAKVEINLVLIMQKRLTLTGSTLRPRSVAEKGAIARAVQGEVWPLIEAGRVRPRIHATFPLEKASEAHRLMESSAHIGKIVLTR